MIPRIAKVTKNLKSVAREQRVHSRLGVLVAVFCVDRFTPVKIDVKVQVGNPDALIAHTDQVHLYPAALVSPHRPMPKCR